jgi:hypothetical protein
MTDYKLQRGISASFDCCSWFLSWLVILVQK